MKTITINKYFSAENSDYEGNPLITWIGPLRKEHIRDLLTPPVQCTDADRAKPAHLRQEYLQRIFEFFFPTPEQVTHAKNLWDAICAAYVREDPRHSDAQSDFEAMCRRIELGQFGGGGRTFGDRPQLITVIGTPGCGKTSVPVRLLRKLSRDLAFYHPHHGFIQRLYVIGSAPTVKTEKSLAWMIYSKLYEALVNAGGTRKAFTTTSANASMLAVECATLARMLKLGILIIDEIQHWMHKKAGIDNHAVEFLTTLSNEIKCPILLLGTWRAIPILEDTLFCGRRATVQGSGEARRIRPGKVWTGFMRRLFRLQFTQNVVPCDDELISTFYEETQGIPDLAVKLMVFTQAAAIASETETITRPLVQACAAQFLKYVCPALELMRNGAMEDDLMIWDAEPVNAEAYTQRVLAEFAMHEKGKKAAKRVMDDAGRAAAAAVAANVMTAMGIASPEQAQAVAGHAAKEAANPTAPEIVKAALGTAMRKGPRPTKDTKKMAQVDVAMAALEPSDIRRIVHQATRAGADHDAALRDAGHMFNVAELEAA